MDTVFLVARLSGYKTGPQIILMICCRNDKQVVVEKKLHIFYYFQAERDGSNEYSDYQPGSLNTTDQLINDLSNIDIVFHIGDITYSNGYISQWDQFTAQVEPIASTVPYMIGRSVDRSH